MRWIITTLQKKAINGDLQKKDQIGLSIIQTLRLKPYRKMRGHMANKTGSVKIHKEDGKIQEERTYQRKDDPKNTPG